TVRLLRLDPTSGKEEVMAADPAYDVGGVLIHPTKRIIQAVNFNKDKLTWKVLDEGIAADFAILGKIRRGVFNVVSRDLADKNWLVAYTTDNGPVYYYTYDRDKKAGHLLFSSRPKLESLALANMHPVHFNARDGLTIHGYLTLPVGVPAKKLPTV